MDVAVQQIYEKQSLPSWSKSLLYQFQGQGDRDLTNSISVLVCLKFISGVIFEDTN